MLCFCSLGLRSLYLTLPPPLLSFFLHPPPLFVFGFFLCNKTHVGVKHPSSHSFPVRCTILHCFYSPPPPSPLLLFCSIFIAQPKQKWKIKEKRTCPHDSTCSAVRLFILFFAFPSPLPSTPLVLPHKKKTLLFFHPHLHPHGLPTLQRYKPLHSFTLHPPPPPQLPSTPLPHTATPTTPSPHSNQRCDVCASRGRFLEGWEGGSVVWCSVVYLQASIVHTRGEGEESWCGVLVVGTHIPSVKQQSGHKQKLILFANSDVLSLVFVSPFLLLQVYL